MTRLEISTRILCAMIQSEPVVNRASVDKAKWAKIATDWAEHLLKENMVIK